MVASCRAHGGNLEALIIIFRERPSREQRAIPALRWILVRLPTYPYHDAFLINAILFSCVL